ncbi:membrane fusion component of tripartite multidrug resistance system [Cystobacter fuscus]|uniref:Membrane fusion component of tripartite multidrug resistance system n=1 Tax=Cystobacter fuscus TaxID=43 RepID=A0A250JCD3_9BACT|nr:HlyD family secretion protein [Cystobacter fuscus]ATB41569.1 membrane fusion component of tripartite multidrug resistance system [Cystobacter fuscus]
MASTATPLVQPEVPAEVIEASRKKGRRGFLVFGVIVAVLLLGIGGYLVATRGQETTDAAQVEADVVPLATRVGGPVLHVLVADNALVHKGDVLVEIDPRDYTTRVKQAEAELESAQAQAQAADAQSTVAEAGAKGGFSSARALVSTSSAGVSSAEAQVSVARAALARAEADAHRAELDLERTKQLMEAKAVSQKTYDDAVATHEAAQAALLGAKAQLAAAEEGRHVAQSRVAEAQGQLDQSAPIDAKIAAARANAQLAHARVKAAEAQLEQARLQLEYTHITAPADGQVSKLSVHEGQLLSTGQTLGEFVPPATYVVANFKETQVGHMHPGQRVTVKVDAFEGESIEGRVESLSSGTGARFSLLPPDNASGNFVKVVQRVPVRIAWVNPPRELALRAGLSAEVTVHTSP